MPTQIPNTKEKIGMATSYLSLGIIGFIWLLVSKRHYYDQKDFIRFHCFQSIFVGLLFSFVPQGLGIIFSLISQILALIPFLLPVVSFLAKIHGLLQMAVKLGSLGLIVYCVVFAVMGKYTNIPYISQIINRMLR